MAAQTVFSMFPVGVPLMEDAQSLSDMPGTTLPAPQLVMLANMAAVTAAEAGSYGDGSGGDEKEMMELKTVGCSYSDSEDENIIRYSFDDQNHREVCIIEYPESPAPSLQAVALGNAAGEEEEDRDKAEDLSHHTQLHPPAPTETPEQGVKRKLCPALTAESCKKKKPFHCKPCHFQAQNEQEFVEHLRTHGVSKLMVVNRVEGRCKTRSKDAETPEAPVPEAESTKEAGPSGDIKGLIKCERCGYNTNRYDHYIAHLKHHSKEGQDHRVFKCTLCPYTTVSQYHWRKHLRNHFPSKLHTCSQCSYFSDRKSNYIQHIRTHTGVRPFQCLYCDYSSSQKTHLTRHMRTHSGERPFKCESCDYLAANQHEVTRHTRQVHNGPKPLSCPYCEYKTADRSNFKKHVELHLNPRQFVCPLCKYAASKKCNLQYHIKSRHAGCDVSVDISKVKLRVKKPDATEDTPIANKADVSSSMDEDFDVDEDDGDDETEPSPINLSIKKSSQPSSSQSEQSNSPEKAEKKSTEREKIQKGKEPDRKVTSRQKKTENPLETVKETQTDTVTPAENKTKKRVKKMTPTKDQTPEKDQSQMGNSDRQRPEKDEGARQMAAKEDEKAKPEKDKEQKNENSGKEIRNLNKQKKSASKKVDKTPECVKEAPPKVDSLEKTQKVVKEKVAKRKAVEALDLSKKSSETPSKAKRVKSNAAEKLQGSVAAEDRKKNGGDDRKTADGEDGKDAKKMAEEDVGKTVGEEAKKTDRKDTKKTDAEDAERTNRDVKKTVGKDMKTNSEEATKTNGEETKKMDGEDMKKTGESVPTLQTSDSTTPSKQKKSRNTKKAAELQPVMDPEKDKDMAVNNQPTDAAEQSAQVDDATGTTPAEPRPAETITSKPDQSEAIPAEVNKPETVEVSPSCSPGEDTPSPMEDHPAPIFVKPTSPPPLVLPQRSKPTDQEDDEGIHSSHEGGSDISDSASEGSDDSGLNSTGAGSGKMPNDPETPTDEIPTPTELKSHMCIFCDRTFPLEVEYRRHLNRHLVNVYYMDNTAKGQK
ncbi:RE1-silencing transcription factor [Cheilinus undulatus]|uniref:RE1-silencing transcription factor n=1 Tax=Cheilinus undulatus TaxID=241271 RepID=UPI001BD29021|nr:RE1-silencing transcription factor [Cheilinus undulatus]XP_041653477.1 RE1-silencing transcription factor [Cheilinus undulatus]